MDEERKLRYDLQKEFLKLEDIYNNQNKEMKELKIDYNRIFEENKSINSILANYKIKINEVYLLNTS
jgi:hypothetical protein